MSDPAIARMPPTMAPTTAPTRAAIPSVVADLRCDDADGDVASEPAEPVRQGAQAGFLLRLRLRVGGCGERPDELVDDGCRRGPSPHLAPGAFTYVRDEAGDVAWRRFRHGRRLYVASA